MQYNSRLHASSVQAWTLPLFKFLTHAKSNCFVTVSEHSLHTFYGSSVYYKLLNNCANTSMQAASNETTLTSNTATRNQHYIIIKHYTFTWSDPTIKRLHELYCRTFLEILEIKELIRNEKT